MAVDPASEIARLEAAVDEAIDLCGGDMRAAIRALIVASEWHEAEIARLAQAVSEGFVRRRRWQAGATETRK